MACLIHPLRRGDDAMTLTPDHALRIWAVSIALRRRSASSAPKPSALQSIDGLLRDRFTEPAVSSALSRNGASDTPGNRALLRLLADMAPNPGPSAALANAARYFKDVEGLLPPSALIASASSLRGGSSVGALDMNTELFGDFTGIGPQNFTRPDDRILDDVADRLTREPVVDASEMHVDVKDGVVILAGSVPHREMKLLAELICAGCSGVVDVDNRLRVRRAGGPRIVGDGGEEL
jgi:hypothetical protein